MQFGIRLVILLGLVSGCNLRLEYGGVGSGGNNPNSVTAPILAEFPMTGYPLAVQKVWKDGQVYLWIARGIDTEVSFQFTREKFFENRLTMIAPISNPFTFQDATPVAIGLKRYTDQLLNDELIGFRFASGVSGIGLLEAPRGPVSRDGTVENLGTRKVDETRTWSSLAQISAKKRKLWVSFETPGPVQFIDALKISQDQNPHHLLTLAAAQKVNAPQMRLNIATDRLTLTPLKPERGTHTFKIQFEVSNNDQPRLEALELNICRKGSAQGCTQTEKVVRAIGVGL